MSWFAVHLSVIMNGKPKILLLQGPVGPFFDALGKYLEQNRCIVRRVIFNGGDWFYSSGRNLIFYRNGQSEWQTFLDKLSDDFKPDFAILFGDERPIHKVAIGIFTQKGIDYWCFEEGYIRPNFVTFERAGNNANSLLRERGEGDLKNIISFPKLRNSNRNSNISDLNVNGISKYYLRNVFVYFSLEKILGIFFPNYIHHREYKTISFLIDYLRWRWTNNKLTKTVTSIEEKIKQDQLNYFVVLLQIQEDLQLLSHGMGWNNVNAIERIITSFSCHASPETKLLFKIHPLNLKSHEDYNLIKEVSFRCGVEDRVLVIRSNRNKFVMTNALAALTINSTAGLEALKYGKNIFTFGRAIYDMFSWPKSSDIVSDLNNFWSAAVDKEVVDWSIIENYTMNSLAAGDFYDQTCFEDLLENVILKLDIRNYHREKMLVQAQDVIISNESS